MRTTRSLLALCIVSCSPAETTLLDPADVAVPEHYEFQSRFAATDSVGYGARVVHHLRIQDLVENIRLATHRIETEGLTAAELGQQLERAFVADASSVESDVIGLRTEPPAIQTSFVAISVSAPSLADAVDAQTAAAVRTWFSVLEANAGANDRPSPYDRTKSIPVHITDEGVDVAAYLEAQLDGVIAFRGGVGFLRDRLDDDNTIPHDGKPFTALEHHWDQAFGCFGASRYFGTFDPRRLAFGARFADYTQDRRIDLSSEYNFGAAVRMAVRDVDAQGPFLLPAWDGFRRGRALITTADGALGPDYQTALADISDDLDRRWEREVAASVVHGINEVLGVVCPCGDENFVYEHSAFLEQATARGDLLGRIAALEQHPEPTMSTANFADLRVRLRAAPYHPTTGVEPENSSYLDDLRNARALVATAYGFERAQIGDEAGDADGEVRIGVRPGTK